MPVPVIARGVLALVATACLTASAVAGEDNQRALFRQAYAAAERGDWQAVEDLSPAERAALQEYVLWPDLRAAWLRAAMPRTDQAEVEAFLDRYGALRPARELRYRYALHLAAAGHFDAFLRIYQRFYQGLDIARLDCLALHAEMAAGHRERVVRRALDLWTVGRSQVDDCDPVFAWLSDNGLLTATDYRRRFDLAIEAREFSLAQWLGKSIDPQHVEVAARWIRARRDPGSFVRDFRQLPEDDNAREQLTYAVERIAVSDPLLALELWEPLAHGLPFSAEQEIRTARHIALWLARDRLPGAYYQLARLPAAAQDAEVVRWRARTSLRERNWDDLLLDVGRMDDEEADREEWRYWRGIALRRTGHPGAAAHDLAALARERGYYGFLAADELRLPYAMDSAPLAGDETTMAELAARPELVRAHELFRVGLDGRARSEWQAAVGHLDARTRLQAALLAHRWGWHSQAIAAAASVGEYDDLVLRYPLAYRELFRRYSATASIPETWAYGVARSESLFMRDVRSGAGAVGLMQLLPSTGRRVAAEIRLPYSGLNTLTDPDSNIRLGTTYLGQMAERFGGNRVLATAAYNAGPQRVEAWLPETGAVDARIWIENIPFNQTRGYVRRVLEAETIFHWRMTGETWRISDRLPPVRAAGEPEQVANN